MRRIFNYFIFISLLLQCLHAAASDKRIEDLFKKIDRIAASDFDSVIIYADSIIPIALKLNDKHALAAAYKAKGTAFYLKGGYPQTILNYQLAYKIAAAKNYTDILFSIYNLYGTFYKSQNNLKAAQEQFTSGYDLAVKLNDSLQMGNSLGDIGLVYMLQHDYEKAEDCFTKALDIHRKNKCALCESYALDYLAEVYAYHARFDEAVNALLLSFDIKKNLKDTMGMAMETNNLGEVYDSKGDLEKALSYFFESLSYSQKIHYQNFVIHTSQMISEMYFKQKNYEKAFQFYKQYTNVKDSVFNEKNAQSINEIEAKYQNEKKQLQIDNLNKENTIKEVTIEKQQNKAYFLYAAAGLLCLIVLIAAIGYRSKQNANRIISAQKAEVEVHRDQIEAKNKEVTDSIQYAKRIQGALLANTGLLKAHLPEHFVLYKPKDIVSGDFYWAAAQSNKFYLCAGDCTGHGVPGAFMSLLNISFLNEAVIEKKIESPDKILDHVRNQIIASLRSQETGEGSRDGMDAVLCMFDLKGMWLRFAAANNPLWLIRNNELKIFAPDKMPVGMHHGGQKDFTLQTIGLRKNDIVYLLTDGYADQFGGEKGKKFKYKKLQELLLEHCNKSMDEQKEILDLSMEKWRGKLEQVDDVLVIGIKF